MSNVFDPAGIVISKKTSGNIINKVLIIRGVSQTYFAQAPVMGIKIEQQVDFSLSKTLKGNFNLVTFQDLPVVITISGMQNLATGCNRKSTDISDLYAKARVGSSGQRIITLTLGGTEYKGIIVAFSQASSDIPGIITYNMTLFGVRVK